MIAAMQAILCGVLLLAATLSAFGQGSLTPPAAPMPTMKTLDQVEPRIVVDGTNTPGDGTNTFIISAPGSYYLTANITGEPDKHGISIQADDVTLDLNGFALISGGGSLVRGIDTPSARSGITIRNGSVRGWSGGGVFATAAVVLAEKLRLVSNTSSTGLAVGNGSLVRDCVASGNATGFYCPDRTHIINCIATVNSGPGFDCTNFVTIVDCTASRNAGHGIIALGNSNIIRCSATRNELRGINAGSRSTVADCLVAANVTDGIAVTTGSVVRNCTAAGNSQNGISASTSCHILGNTCEGNTTGIRASGDYNRVDSNDCSVDFSAGIGFFIGGIFNVVVRNTARGPRHSFPGFPAGVVDTAFVFTNPGNNSYGPILGRAIGEISSNSPWANFQNF